MVRDYSYQRYVKKKNVCVVGEIEYGLFKCVLGRRTDMCSGSDLDGEDEDDARKNHGVIGS